VWQYRVIWLITATAIETSRIDSDMPTIFIVGDSQLYPESLHTGLIRTGCRVLEEFDLHESLGLLQRQRIDVVLLLAADLTLAELQYCREVYQSGQALLMIMVARYNEAVCIAGLDEGADDIASLALGVGELAARIRALLRRKERQANLPIVRVGDLRLDRTGHRLWRGTSEIALTQSEVDLLAQLLLQSDTVHSTAQLALAIGGNHIADQQRRVADIIGQLRAKIEPNPQHPRYIRTIRNVGYLVSSTP
jgi:DNA-binding response OmpR family regulator